MNCFSSLISPFKGFSRSFPLPSEVNSERVDASLTDGILTVRLEKSEEQKPRQISVRVS